MHPCFPGFLTRPVVKELEPLLISSANAATSPQTPRPAKHAGPNAAPEMKNSGARVPCPQTQHSARPARSDVEKVSER